MKTSRTYLQIELDIAEEQGKLRTLNEEKKKLFGIEYLEQANMECGVHDDIAEVLSEIIRFRIPTEILSVRDIYKIFKNSGWYFDTGHIQRARPDMIYEEQSNLSL